MIFAHRKRAFTLIELMVVVLIIGILAALAIPRLMAMAAKARLVEFKPQLKSIYTLQEVYSSEHGHYAPASGFMQNNTEIGYIHPSSGFFSYAVLAPSISGTMVNQEVGISQMANGHALQMPDGTTLDASDGVVACVDGEGFQYGTSAAIVNTANLTAGQDACN